MEALIKKTPNTQGNYSVQYFGIDYKNSIISFKSLADALCFIADLSDNEAILKFEGDKFIVYQWSTNIEKHNKDVKFALNHLK